MKVGIVVYSQTGHTNLVAEKLKEGLVEAGHSAGIERIITAGNVFPGAKEVRFDSLPVVDTYDAMVFASPVQAFSLSPAMTAYLKQLASLGGKKVACLVTKQLPFYWTGGNRAIAQMKNLCESKDAVVLGSAIVIWRQSRREQQIDEAVARLSSLF